MEACCCVNSVTVSSIPRTGLADKPYLRGRTINVACITRRHAEARRLKVVDCRVQAAGTAVVSSEASGAPSENGDQKESNLVFVAGSTGRVGSRLVRELLKLGFRVRAGVRNRQSAESLVKSVQQMKLDDSAGGGNKPIENLELVECDLEEPDQIVRALGRSSIVLCCIGASEKEVFDITGPYRIDYMATKNLIEAAKFAKIDHFILLTSLGTNKVGFPAVILNLFWGVLIWKRKAEEELIASGLPYTIVRPGGMERPTDSYKETHNIMLSEEDTLFGGQVSNLQVAELMAIMAKNRSLSYCKVVEVIAETTAPLTPMEELLAKIPSQRVPPKEPGDADGPLPAVKEKKTAEPPSPSVEKQASPAKPSTPRPLSPYTAYEDLKPPTTPSPTPSSSTSGSKASNTTALEAPNSSPAAVEINASEASNTVFESEVLQKEGKKASSLSPYPNYDDLKPPGSPAPNPPSSQGSNILEAALTPGAADSESIETTKAEAEPSEQPTLSTPQPQARPLSPYYAYEDLKPPSSPSPVPSGPKEASSDASVSSDTATATATGGNDVASTGTASPVEKDPAPRSATHHSPYIVYEDLKPPSSPIPSVPVLSANNKPAPPAVNKSEATTEDSPVNQKPLSPFTMYEDLKPPSSPTPSLKTTA